MLMAGKSEAPGLDWGACVLHQLHSIAEQHHAQPDRAWSAVAHEPDPLELLLGCIMTRCQDAEQAQKCPHKKLGKLHHGTTPACHVDQQGPCPVYSHSLADTAVHPTTPRQARLSSRSMCLGPSCVACGGILREDMDEAAAASSQAATPLKRSAAFAGSQAGSAPSQAGAGAGDARSGAQPGLFEPAQARTHGSGSGAVPVACISSAAACCACSCSGSGDPWCGSASPSAHACAPYGRQSA